MKLKFAAIAATAVMFAAPAFAVTDYDYTDNATAAGVETLAAAEFAAVVLSGDGNVAFINQESSANLASIDQVGATNFAVIMQSENDGAIAVIYQTGDSNRARISQK
jgi:Curlin associated repeat